MGSVGRDAVKLAVASLVLVTLLCGCRTTRSMSIIARERVNASELLGTALEYEDLGRVRGGACRFFVLNLIPFGDSTPAAALEDALEKVGGDAMIDVLVSTSLYGLAPIYNLLSFTCTSMTGTAIDLKW